MERLEHQEPAPVAPGCLELNKGRYRDSQFYISHTAPDESTERGLSVHGAAGGTSRKLNAAVLDLLGEDQKALVEHQRRFHWVCSVCAARCMARSRKLIQCPLFW